MSEGKALTVDEMVERVVSRLKREGGNRVMTDFCPECLRKDQQAELTKRDHQHELEKAVAEAERLKAEASHARMEADTRAKEALESAQNILAHIENPESCKDLEHCEISKKLTEFRYRTLKPKEVGDKLREWREKERK